MEARREKSGNGSGKNLRLMKKMGIHNYLMASLYILPILTYKQGAIQMLATGIIFAALACLYFYDDFYLALPILLFFYMQLILPGGIALFRIYSIFLILKVWRKPLRLDAASLLPLLVMMIYCVACIFPLNIRLALFIIFDMIFLLFYVKVYLINNDKFRCFFKYYALAALSAVAYGVLRMTGQLNTAVFVDGNWVYVTRFVATYNDPNYLGFFFNIGIFSLISMDLFRSKNVQRMVLLLLYLAMIATLSTTAILCNAGGVLLYLILIKRIHFKTAVSVLLLLLLIFFSYTMALEKSIPLISDAAIKVKSKIIEMETNNFSSFTSQRTDIWKTHLDYFEHQSNLKIILGGNVITGYLYDESTFETVSHQEFIDMLLNFGLLGTGLMIYSYIYRGGGIFLNLMKYKKEEDVTRMLIKYIWLFYGFGLTMFPGWMFYLFFFI